MTRRIIELASMFGHYGYRMIHGLLRREGWWVNCKRVERIWRQESLKVPKKRPNVAVYDSTMSRVFGFGPGVRITCGARSSTHPDT